MREIEIKAQINDLSVLLANLSKKSVQLSSPIKQHDVVYGQPGVADNAKGSIWLRIRTENDTTTIFTLKQQHSGGLDSIEHEVEVSNSDELESIIKILGFTLYSDLIKVRRKGHIDDIEICVDEVDGLGSFIEAEKITDIDADNAQVVNELWVVLEEFEVDRSSEVFEGYDVLMNKKIAEAQN